VCDDKPNDRSRMPSALGRVLILWLFFGFVSLLRIPGLVACSQGNGKCECPTSAAVFCRSLSARKGDLVFGGVGKGDSKMIYGITGLAQRGLRLLGTIAASLG
jgi:hypothetical protein